MAALRTPQLRLDPDWGIWIILASVLLLLGVLAVYL